MKSPLACTVIILVSQLCLWGLANAAEASSPKNFHLRDFGGTNLKCPGINRGIDAAAKAGGGTVELAAA